MEQSLKRACFQISVAGLVDDEELRLREVLPVVRVDVLDLGGKRRCGARAGARSDRGSEVRSPGGIPCVPSSEHIQSMSIASTYAVSTHTETDWLLGAVCRWSRKTLMRTSALFSSGLSACQRWGVRAPSPRAQGRRRLCGDLWRKRCMRRVGPEARGDRRASQMMRMTQGLLTPRLKRLCPMARSSDFVGGGFPLAPCSRLLAWLIPDDPAFMHNAQS